MILNGEKRIIIKMFCFRSMELLVVLLKDWKENLHVDPVISGQHSFHHLSVFSCNIDFCPDLYFLGTNSSSVLLTV